LSIATAGAASDISFGSGVERRVMAHRPEEEIHLPELAGRAHRSFLSAQAISPAAARGFQNRWGSRQRPTSASCETMKIVSAWKALSMNPYE